MRRILPFLSLALLVFWGCHKKSSVAIPPSEPAPSAPVEVAPPAVTPPTITPEPAPLESAPLAKTITSPSNLELGEMYFRIGNYKEAAKALEAHLRNNPKSNPKSKNRDLALFHLGLSRALANDSSRDMRQAEAAFRLLIAEDPSSPYKNQAEFILGLQAQIDKLRVDVKDRDEKIKKLNDELQVLKEIDLQRRPSRPKE